MSTQLLSTFIKHNHVGFFFFVIEFYYNVGKVPEALYMYFIASKRKANQTTLDILTLCLLCHTLEYIATKQINISAWVVKKKTFQIWL